MKKLLGSTLALALFLPAGANAELLKNLKVGGQLDVQTTSADNVTDLVTRGAAKHDHIGSAFARTMVKLDWDLLDDVHARVGFVKGTFSHGATNPRQYGSGAESVTTLEANTYVEEANVKIDKLFGFTDMTMGRQFYGENGDLVIYYGPKNNYGLNVTALDAFRFDWNGEHVSVTGIVGKTSAPAALSAGTAGHTDLRGIVVSCNKHENVKGALYVYNQMTHAVGDIGTDAGKNTNLYVAGVRTNLAFGGVTGHVELAKNFGQDRTNASAGYTSYKGWAFLGKAGYKLDLSNVGMINPWGEFGYGTGDENGSFNGNNTFTPIATSYYPGGIYGRFRSTAAEQLGGAGSSFSANGLSNRIIWGFGVKTTPAALDKLTMGVQFYKYAFHTKVSNTANSRSIGSEFDLTADWKHSENVSIKGTLGSFQPGQYVAQIQPTGKNPATMAALDFTLKFN